MHNCKRHQSIKESLYIWTWYTHTADRLLVDKKISVRFNTFDCSLSLCNILIKKFCPWRLKRDLAGGNCESVHTESSVVRVEEVADRVENVERCRLLAYAWLATAISLMWFDNCRGIAIANRSNIMTYPKGQQEDVGLFCVIDNRANVQWRSKCLHNVFDDDCGAWDST